MIFPAGLCVRSQQDDVDDLAESALYWDLEPFQLSAGRFHSELRAIHTEHLQCSAGWRSTGLVVRGEGPRDCVTLITVIHSAAPIHIYSAVLEPNEVVARRYGEEIEASTLGGCETATLSINRETLDRQLRVLLGQPLDHWRSRNRLYFPDPAHREWLNRVLLHYLDFGLASGITADPDGARRLENRILETLVESIVIPEVEAPRPNRLRLAKQAQDYLHAHAKEPISIADVCEAVGASERTLYLGFVERFGISPKAYFAKLRLNGARRELRRGSPNQSVTSVAMDWGFFHLGRFAIEYRSMFGESPVETLRQARKHALGYPDPTRAGVGGGD